MVSVGEAAGPEKGFHGELPLLIDIISDRETVLFGEYSRFATLRHGLVLSLAPNKNHRQAVCVYYDFNGHNTTTSEVTILLCLTLNTKTKTNHYWYDCHLLDSLFGFTAAEKRILSTLVYHKQLLRIVKGELSAEIHSHRIVLQQLLN